MPGHHSGNWVTLESLCQIHFNQWLTSMQFFFKWWQRGWHWDFLPEQKPVSWAVPKVSLDMAHPLTYIPKHLYLSQYVCLLHTKSTLHFVTHFILWLMPAPPLVVSIPSLQWPPSNLSLKTQLSSRRSSMLLPAGGDCCLIRCSHDVLMHASFFGIYYLLLSIAYSWVHILYTP